jgi:uncharacterized RDD family membrane protein YckC
MRTIEITTSQKVTIEYALASLRDRFFAFFIDSSVLWIGLMLLTFLFYLVGPSMDITYFYWIVLAPIFFFYTPVSEYLMHGQTLGKRALGIKVVRLNGRSPTSGNYAIRWAFRMIDIWLSIGSIGALLISSSEKSQRLGGLLSNTVVIRTRSKLQLKINDLLNINTRANHEVKYPEVVQFTEDEMLFMKSTIERIRKYPNKAHRQALAELVDRANDTMGRQETPKNKVNFLTTLINDYIVLTR